MGPLLKSSPLFNLYFMSIWHICTSLCLFYVFTVLKKCLTIKTMKSPSLPGECAQPSHTLNCQQRQLPLSTPTSFQILQPTVGVAVFFDPGHGGADRGAHCDDGNTAPTAAAAAAAAAALLHRRSSATTCRYRERVLHSNGRNRLGLYLSGRCWPSVRPKVTMYSGNIKASPKLVLLNELEKCDGFGAMRRTGNWLKFQTQNKNFTIKDWCLCNSLICKIKFPSRQFSYYSLGLISLTTCILFFRKRSKDIPQKYIKAVYREYTDSTYTVPKPRPAWTGRSSLLITP